jgi:N4-gp56 family major capsid protein
MNFGQVRPMPSHEGQGVNFRRFDSLAATTSALTEGVTPSDSAMTVSQLTSTPAQYGAWVEISDILDFTAPDPVLTEFTQVLAEQAANSLDQITKNVLVAGTNVMYANSRVSRITVAAGDVLTAVEIRKAVRTMQANKVNKITSILNASTGVGTKPVNAAYVGIVGPSALYDLKAASGFVPVEAYGTSAGGTLPFEVGALDDVRFVLSNNSHVFTGAGAAGIDVHASIILGADAYGMISPMGIENIIKGFGVNGNDPLNQRATSGWKAYYSAVILQQLAILRIEHAVSA